MSPALPSRILRLSRRWPAALLLLCAALASSCKAPAKPDTEQADQMAMWLDSVPQLKTLSVSNAEIVELNKTHEAGLTDPSAVMLIQLARDRKQPFAEGQSVADLLNSGFSEDTVISLARMNLLGPWAGEARAMRLTGMSDKIILAVARRHVKGLPVLSGEKLGELKNTGVSDAVILEMVQRGDTDKRADQFIAQREREAGGHKFIYETHAHK